jgi:uncharacterized protein YkwD
MRRVYKCLLITLAMIAPVAPMQAWASVIVATDVQVGAQGMPRGQAEALFALGNQARTASGVKALEWDAALAAAALAHCERMAAAGSISHQYTDEADVDVRAGAAGARFSLIEENVAAGGSSAIIHQAWMSSPHHRENLLNPQVDRVGLAVVERGGMMYAVADFARGVLQLGPDQVEAAVSSLVRSNGMAVHDGAAAVARQACGMDHGMPAAIDDERPEFIMRWQDAELTRLPGQLLARMATGRYKDAAVASCPVPGNDIAFTSYRIAVMLLRPALTVKVMASRQ